MNSSGFLLKGFNCNPPKILARCNFVCLDPFVDIYRPALFFCACPCWKQLLVLIRSFYLLDQALDAKSCRQTIITFQPFDCEEVSGVADWQLSCHNLLCRHSLHLSDYHGSRSENMGILSKRKTISKIKIKLTALYVAATILTLSFSDLQSLTFKQVIHTSQ